MFYRRAEPTDETSPYGSRATEPYVWFSFALLRKTKDKHKGQSIASQVKA
jgi:hypothetical protein